MTEEQLLERAARSWIEIGSNQAPAHAVEAALSRVETTPQERRALLPWRWRRGAGGRLIAAAAMASLVIAALLIVVFAGLPGRLTNPPRPSSNVVPVASPRSSPTASAGPKRSSSPSLPPATPQPFSSSHYGYTITVPAGWKILSSDPPYPVATGPGAPSGLVVDYFRHINPEWDVYVASWPLPKNLSPEAWIATFEGAGQRSGIMPTCWPSPEHMERATVDGHPAWIHGGVAGCSFVEAIIFDGSRVVQFTAVGDGGLLPRKRFDPFLQSMRLNP